MKFSLLAYFKNAYAELRKVTWPSRQAAIQSTATVVVLSVGVALFLGALDFGFNAGLNYLIELTA
ncbi:MAG: preprotein translocase subunit SecE [Candidatus Kerfeldbacteria bacterium]|nr:preprotein translocase subunit SecE [Candidatus Kerfeldbacteria bacterium]